MNLADRLVSWAQNEEMIDQYFTEHGKDCNEAADKLNQYEAALKMIRDSTFRNAIQLRGLADMALYHGKGPYE